MFCSKCGKEVFDEAVICPYCGCAIENKIISENVTTQNKTKKIGVSFVISGIVDFVISVFCAILQGVSDLWFWVDEDLVDRIDVCHHMHEALIVVGVVLIILGIILTATKKPLVNKKTQKVTTILMTVGIAIVNILLLIPYILYQIEY